MNDDLRQETIRTLKLFGAAILFILLLTQAMAFVANVQDRESTYTQHHFATVETADGDNETVTYVVEVETAGLFTSDTQLTSSAMLVASCVNDEITMYANSSNRLSHDRVVAATESCETHDVHVQQIKIVNTTEAYLPA